MKAPTFYSTNGYQPPTNCERTAFQDAFGTNLSFYDYIAERPVLEKNFQTYMKSFQMRSPHWLELFPVEERIIKDFREEHKDNVNEAALLVDVGGGRGQDIKLFHRQFPHVLGRLILQDRNVPTSQIEKSMEGIEVQEYDFFTPQPVQGQS